MFAIIGSTGSIGSRLLELLDPRDITAMVRSHGHAEALAARGIRTVIGDLANAPGELLFRHLGSLGPHISHLARGIDDREVIPERDPKSVGKEITLDKDVRGAEQIRPLLRRLSEQVARRLGL